MRQLRENSVSIGKVYNIIVSLFGAMSNVPFSKRALWGLCGEISRDQVDDDVRKTMEVFAELGGKHSGLNYKVQPGEERRVRLEQVACSTYRMSLYDMPFGPLV